MRIIRIWKERGKRNLISRSLSKNKYYGAIMIAVERSNTYTRYATEHTHRVLLFTDQESCQDWYEKQITREEFDDDHVTLTEE